MFWLLNFSHVVSLLAVLILATVGLTGWSGQFSQSLESTGAVTALFLASMVSMPFTLNQVLVLAMGPIRPARSFLQFILWASLAGLVIGYFEGQPTQPQTPAVNLVTGAILGIVPGAAWYFVLARLDNRAASAAQPSQGLERAQWIRRRFLVLLGGALWAATLIGTLTVGWSAVFFGDGRQAPFVAGLSVGGLGAAILAGCLAAPALFLWALYQSSKIK